MRIAIIQFPGSNCERETSLAVKRAGMEPVDFLWNTPAEMLQEFAGFVLVGGFSYEDRSRAGIIAALDPLLTALKLQSQQGKPILGICNGAQILVESGLVPGIEHDKVGMALTENKRMRQGKVLGTGYYNAWVHIRLSDNYQRNAFTRHLSAKDVLRVPVAHAEGRFVMQSGLAEELTHQGLQLFQYCNAAGKITDEFPINPNGSLFNIAAIANKSGNVLAMMPHPERTTAGDKIFHSMRDYIAEGYVTKVLPLAYYPRAYVVKKYRSAARECIIQPIITDNVALTVENTLQQLGIPVTVRRYTHWELPEDEALLKKILSSGVLYNERKETTIQLVPDVAEKYLLVRAHNDMLGQAAQQMLRDHYNFSSVPVIQHSILWRIQATAGSLDAYIDSLLNTHIFFNPYAYDCYYYEPTT